MRILLFNTNIKTIAFNRNWWAILSVSWDIERIMGINGLTNENQTVRLSFMIEN